MPRASPVSARIVRAVLRAVADHDVEPARVLDAAGLKWLDVADPDALVPLEAELRLWKEAVRITGDPALGVSSAEQIGRGTFGAVEYAARSSPTLRKALEVVARFGQALHGMAIFEVQEDEDVARLVYRSPHPQGETASAAAAELALCASLTLIRDSVEESLDPLWLAFRHPEPAHADRLRALARAPVRFDAPRDELALDARWLRAPMREPDPELCELLTSRLRSDLGEGAERPATDAVRAAVQEALTRGSPSLPTVARQLGVSGRVLQKRLQAEGTSFRQLLELTREELAREYLTQADLPLSEVAVLLGYSEVSAFHRAFRRWIGQSPGEFRRHAIEQTG